MNRTFLYDCNDALNCGKSFKLSFYIPFSKIFYNGAFTVNLINELFSIYGGIFLLQIRIILYGSFLIFFLDLFLL